jgi:hypothetical protein
LILILFITNDLECDKTMKAVVVGVLLIGIVGFVSGEDSSKPGDLVEIRAKIHKKSQDVTFSSRGASQRPCNRSPPSALKSWAMKSFEENRSREPSTE